MSEISTLWPYLRDIALPREGQYSRIETETCPGYPDVAYTLRGTSGHLELKFARHHLPFGKDGLRKDQIIWIEGNTEKGGEVWIVAEVDKQIFFVYGGWARDFNSFTYDQLKRRARLSFSKDRRKVAIETFRLEIARLLVKKSDLA